MRNSFLNKSVLITGGTKGIGLATGLAFGRYGARCVLTHRWGSADEDEIRSLFANCGAPPPLILEADVASEDDTTELMKELRSSFERIDVFVSNVAFGQLTETPDQYTFRGLASSIEYTAWPIASYSQAIKNHFGHLPRYVIGLSSPGSVRYVPNYDFIACAKSVLETMARYLAYHYAREGTRVNVIRAEKVETDSLMATIGSDRVKDTLLRAPQSYLTVEEVADVAIALCSGLMDAVTGQVLVVDRGVPFDNDKNL